MPPALTPELALDYVRELSADVRAGVVLTTSGHLMAGPRTLAEPARALLEAAGAAGELEAGTADGVVCAARTDAHAIVAVCGRFAIPGVVRQDLRAALAALEARPPDVPPRGLGPSTDEAAEARLGNAAARLISAAQREFRE